MEISSLAGRLAPDSILMNVAKVVADYYTQIPDLSLLEQRVSFGTSGHRGSSCKSSFNEMHILAITQAICDFRLLHGISGPLFLGIDTHALSEPALVTAVEVLAANAVHVMLSEGEIYTPTPVISHAILVYNRGRKEGLADGIVITPSHNPPDEGGFKYNATHGGPADVLITRWIEARANEHLAKNLIGIKRLPTAQAFKASTTHRYDYLNTYVNDLGSVIDMDVIRDAKLHLGVDPLGGAGVHYWQPIADRYGLDLTIVNNKVDQTFRFMSVDWDGKIRMDPSSPYAMHQLIGLKDRFQIAFACDTDHDRHGIVTQSVGLLTPNHYLAVAIDYLFQHRPQWSEKTAIGKTLVSSQMIDRVAHKLKRKLIEVPVGFKWFSAGLFDGSIGFGGEESAGASFLRRDGTVWTTDKDGLIPALLSAEMTARLGKDPGVLYQELVEQFGEPFYERIDAKATVAEKIRLQKITPEEIQLDQLAGEKIESIISNAPGNDAPIGGVKVTTKNGWFAARPSGTECIYKIYAESFLGKDYLQKILVEAQAIVDQRIRA